jgi:hypothetical protein
MKKTDPRSTFRDDGRILLLSDDLCSHHRQVSCIEGLLEKNDNLRNPLHDWSPAMLEDLPRAFACKGAVCVLLFPNASKIAGVNAVSPGPPDRRTMQ